MNILAVVIIALFVGLAVRVAFALLVAPSLLYRAEHRAVNGSQCHKNRRNLQAFQQRYSPRDYPCRLEYERQQRAEQTDNRYD